VDDDMLALIPSDSDTDFDCGSPINAEDVELMMRPFELEEYRDLSARQRQGRRAPATAADFPITSSDGEFDPADASIRVGQGGRRTSTKVRAATLGYLWGFSRDPDRLREETRRLRDERDQQVLHLCGCGIPFNNSDGVLVPGCCEWSHLRLGTAEENGLHKSYHTVMGATVAEGLPGPLRYCSSGAIWIRLVLNAVCVPFSGGLIARGIYFKSLYRMEPL
jgi:hypothetical protein